MPHPRRPGARRFTTRVAAHEVGTRLADVAHRWLQSAIGLHVSRSTVRRLIVGGAIRVDGRIVTIPGWEVSAGATLEARIDLARLPASAGHVLAPALPILYEDDDLVAVNKPPGIPTVPTADPRRASVFALLKQALARQHSGGVGQVYLGVHQRLDVDTSGVVVFTKRPEANEAIARVFAARDVRKAYIALTVRPRELPAESWRVDQPIEIARGGAARAEAVTEFSVTEVMARALLVEARPATGRKHQVRIHLAASGLPILGDTRYGGPPSVGQVAIPRVMLHAARLTIPLPSAGAVLGLSAPLPPDFESLLRALSRERTSPEP